jgi:AraC-like DNA-binding protein
MIEFDYFKDMDKLINEIRQSRQLSTLVENKTTFSANNFELSMFETYRVAERVELAFDFPVVTSMLTGKKVMHIDDGQAFDFHPGQSVVFPSKKKMVIDFPLASMNEPTQCLALGINEDRIDKVIEQFNDCVAIEEEHPDWKLSAVPDHLLHDSQISHLINRIMHTFVKDNKSKDILLDLMINELIVRLLQTKVKSLIISDRNNVYGDTRIGFIVKFIRENLTNHNITVELLADKVYMSPSHFHKKFKNTVGVSPIEYLNSEKVKFAKKLMKEDKKLRIAEVAFKSGFNCASYFNRQFKKR